MKLRHSNPEFGTVGRDGPRSLRAFTMVEIALSLAIIGFALVAIIGVLPIGMSVQKDNREQTIINLDAAYLMDAIRGGAQGQDELTNYIVSIADTTAVYLGKPPGPADTPQVSTYDTNQSTVAGNHFGPCLTNGFNIIGLLSTPKYVRGPNTIDAEVVVNSVTAIFRAINAPAVDQGQSQASIDSAFQYQVTVEIIPSAGSPFPGPFTNTWQNLSSPFVIAPNATTRFAAPVAGPNAQNLVANLYDIRLTFQWPVFPNGQLGGGRQVFRTSVAGTFLTNTNSLRFQPPGGPGFTPPLAFGASDRLANGAYLYFLQPQTFTAQTP